VNPIIAIVTDFGIEDTYVGVMKSVILGIQPAARLIDLTHAIPRGSIRAGAFELWRAASYLPKGCILLGVVDPGVGTARRPVTLAFDELLAVGPDNGLFSYLLFEHRLLGAHELAAPELRLPEPSSTFHGRDVFAPAAAHLARGTSPEAFGPPVPQLLSLPLPVLRPIPGAIEGEILHCDVFGNLVTSIGRLELHGAALALRDWTGRELQAGLDARSCQLVLPDGKSLPLAHTFADVPAGAALAYTGSTGLLEIAVNGGDAAEVLGLNVGDVVRLSEIKG